MDANQARDGPARQVHSEHTLTAYHQEATEVGAVGQPSASASTLDPWTSNSSHLDSQSRSLRQASLALDTAYERITNLRNSINNLLNRMPPEITATTTSITNTSPTTIPPRRSLTRDSSASLRPPHSALVLSDPQTTEDNQRAARLRTLIPPSARQRLEEFESTNRNGTRREFVWDRFSHGTRTGSSRSDVHPRVPRPRTPPMPDIVVPRARDLVAQRRDLQSVNRDDSSTMIGRRVAARLFINGGSSESHGSVPARPSLPQIEQRLQAQTAEIAQELENMTDRVAFQRFRRVEIGPPSARRGGSAAGRGPSASTLSSGIWTPPAPVDVSGDVRLRPLPPNGGRPLDNTPRIHPPPSVSRMTPDVLSFEDLASTARRSLSAAYREHIANISPDSPRNLANTPEVRGTLVGLLTRERDEQFLPVRHTDPARLGSEANRRGGLSARSNPLPQVPHTRRRRGWTRLNADGDEIDSDDDDITSPPTRPVRMRSARGNPSADTSATLSSTITIEDILWRTSGSDSEPDVLSPDATESSCHSLFQSTPPPASIHYPNPLPTPVEEMLEYPTTKPPRSQTIRVSKYASLAGR